MSEKKKTIRLDDFNKKILAIIHKQADISNQNLAEQVGLSPSACFQRRKALQEAGYFFNFHTEMDLDRIFEHVLAYVEFFLESNTGKPKQAFEAAIRDIPEIMDCIRVGGQSDYIAFCCFPDIATLTETCDALCAREELGVKRVEVRPVLERTKWYLGYPIEKLKWKE